MHREQYHGYLSMLRELQLDMASANKLRDQAQRRIVNLEAQLAATNEQLNRLDSLKCCICYESFVEKQSSCGHFFCGKCIDR
jgi:hypothetical protein